jgi:hypothetical protein
MRRLEKTEGERLIEVGMRKRTVENQGRIENTPYGNKINKNGR